MKRPWDAVAWWEIRRIPFNFALLVAGGACIIIVELIGSRLVRPGEDVIEPVALIFGAVFYGLLANVFYTLGWISELCWCGGDTNLTESMRPKVFRTGLVFSVLLTLLPAIIIPLIWSIGGFQHGE